MSGCTSQWIFLDVERSARLPRRTRPLTMPSLSLAPAPLIPPCMFALLSGSFSHSASLPHPMPASCHPFSLCKPLQLAQQRPLPACRAAFLALSPSLYDAVTHRHNKREQERTSEGECFSAIAVSFVAGRQRAQRAACAAVPPPGGRGEAREGGTATQREGSPSGAPRARGTMRIGRGIAS